MDIKCSNENYLCYPELLSLLQMFLHEGMRPFHSGVTCGHTWAIGYCPISCAMPTALLRPRLVSLRAGVDNRTPSLEP